jgi:hypothetical protein
MNNETSTKPSISSFLSDRRHLLEILCCQTLSDIFQWTEKGCDRHHVAHHPTQPTHPFCIFPPYRLKKENKIKK